MSLMGVLTIQKIMLIKAQLFDISVIRWRIITVLCSIPEKEHILQDAIYPDITSERHDAGKKDQITS